MNTTAFQELPSKSEKLVKRPAAAEELVKRPAAAKAILWKDPPSVDDKSAWLLIRPKGCSRCRWLPGCTPSCRKKVKVVPA